MIGFAFVLPCVVLGIPRGAGTIFIAHATIGMSHTAAVVRARLTSVGATTLGAMLRITVSLGSSGPGRCPATRLHAFAR